MILSRLGALCRWKSSTDRLASPRAPKSGPADCWCLCATKRSRSRCASLRAWRNALFGGKAVGAFAAAYGTSSSSSFQGSSMTLALPGDEERLKVEPLPRAFRALGLPTRDPRLVLDFSSPNGLCLIPASLIWSGNGLVDLLSVSTKLLRFSWTLLRRAAKSL